MVALLVVELTVPFFATVIVLPLVPPVTNALLFDVQFTLPLLAYPYDIVSLLLSKILSF